MAEVTDAEVFDRSAAVAEFSVVSAESFIAGNKTIRTRLVLSPVEVFKGKVPRKVEMTVPGGTIGARTDHGSDSLPLEVGKSYVLMMGKDGAGKWTAGPMHTFHDPWNRILVFPENAYQLPGLWKPCFRPQSGNRSGS